MEPVTLDPLDADLSMDLADGNSLATPLTEQGFSLMVRLSRRFHWQLRAHLRNKRDDERPSIRLRQVAAHCF